MKDAAQQTIELFGNRSDSTVTRMVLAFALGGALMDIASHVLASIFSSMFSMNGSFPLLWGMWIPLCFITIPPIHYLCRQVQSLQRRVDALESLDRSASK